MFNTTFESATTLTPPTATDLDRLTGADAPRSFAFWTILDLEMLTVRDRVESSPLLRDGMVSAATDLTMVLTLN